MKAKNLRSITNKVLLMTLAPGLVFAQSTAGPQLSADAIKKLKTGDLAKIKTSLPKDLGKKIETLKQLEASKAGPIHGGGGNTVNSKLIFEYIKDLEDFPFYSQKLVPILNDLDAKVPNFSKLLRDNIDTIMSFVFVPKKLKDATSEMTGLPFDSDQIAINKLNGMVFFDSELFDKLATEQQAMIIIQECLEYLTLQDSTEYRAEEMASIHLAMKLISKRQKYDDKTFAKMLAETKVLKNYYKNADNRKYDYLPDYNKHKWHLDSYVFSSKSLVDELTVEITKAKAQYAIDLAQYEVKRKEQDQILKDTFSKQLPAIMERHVKRMTAIYNSYQFHCTEFEKIAPHISWSIPEKVSTLTTEERDKAISIIRNIYKSYEAVKTLGYLSSPRKSFSELIDEMHRANYKVYNRNTDLDLDVNLFERLYSYGDFESNLEKFIYSFDMGKMNYYTEVELKEVLLKMNFAILKTRSEFGYHISEMYNVCRSLNSSYEILLARKNGYFNLDTLLSYSKIK